MDNWRSSTGAALVERLTTTSASYLIGAALLGLVFLLMQWTPKLDPREPPFLKPRFPLVGHIVGLIRHKVDYFALINKRARRPIVTLPMLNGKLYVLMSPSLVQAALRSKDMTFDVFSLEFAGRVMGLSDATVALIRGTGTIEESMLPRSSAIHKSALSGRSLYTMNVAALKYIAAQLNDTIPTDGEGLAIPSVYLWLRELMTMATAEALYGTHNPFRGMDTKDLVDALWDFEGHLPPLLLGIWPSVVARRAYLARKKVQDVLQRRFYDPGYDGGPDVAEVTRARAALLRDIGCSMDDVGKLELGLLFVATTNTIPTLFWIWVNVWMNDKLVEDLRKEALAVVEMTAVKDGEKHRTAVVDISVLEERCPLLVSCYREAIRLGNQLLGTRRVMQDTTLTDDDGTTYLLKEGVDVMWSGKLLHHSAGIWGSDSLTFRADRFAPSGARQDPKEERLKKQGYVPFGGGKHYCPGRNFAFAENLGFMAAFISGFHVVGLREENVKMRSPNLGEAMVKPPPDGEGGSVTIHRRKGWEDVQWSFVC